EFSEEEAHEVLEILSMFEALKDSASNAEKAKEEIIESWVARFPGFDGNSEWDYLGYLDFLVKQKRYAHVADPQRLDSRVPLLVRYREMLTIWEQMDRPSILNTEQVKQLFSWWKRPE